MKKSAENFHRLLQLLVDGEYHQGTRLGEQLGISRTAVWKMINKLQAYDVPINVSKTYGYALEESFVLLNESQIKQALPDIDIDVFETINSTNDYLKKHATAANVQVCLAEQQQSGRGRRQHQWHSPFGQNIYLSLRYRFDVEISQLSGLSLLVSLAVVDTLSCQFPEQAFSLKWPNDILIDGRKLAGILIELAAESHGDCQAIIGIGINVNMRQTPELQCASLRGEQQVPLDRNPIVIQIIEQLLSYLQKFTVQGFSAFIKQWQTYDDLLNQPIRLQHHEQTIIGMSQGVTKDGHLLMKTADNKLLEFASGEAHKIRKMFRG